MTSNEKITTVLETIKEQADLSAKGEVLTFTNISNDYIFNITIADIRSILKKLETDEKVIEIVELATATVQEDNTNMDPYDYDCTPYFKVTVTDKFNDFYEQVVNGVIYTTKEEFAELVKNRDPKDLPGSSEQPHETTYTITYNEITRKIVLNSQTVIRELKYDSENENVIKYLVANPNRNIPKAEIEKAIGKTLKKSFKKIVENYGFPNNLGKAFFSYNKSAIKFNNPIEEEQIEI